MAENVTLARPYAEAAFKLAREAKALAPWKDALDRMALAAADADMRALIANPKLSSAQVAQVFLDVAGKLSEQQKNFVQVLVANERLALLPEIHKLFVQLKNEEEGVKDARITSAFALDDAALKKLVAELEPRFNCKLNPSVNVDPELIGGVKIAVGDEVIDASVRGKLAAMATALKN
jgi:F-type H+-transporting ATPase subunit delta